MVGWKKVRSREVIEGRRVEKGGGLQEGVLKGDGLKGGILLAGSCRLVCPKNKLTSCRP